MCRVPTGLCICESLSPRKWPNEKRIEKESERKKEKRKSEKKEGVKREGVGEESERDDG